MVVNGTSLEGGHIHGIYSLTTIDYIYTISIMMTAVVVAFTIVYQNRGSIDTDWVFMAGSTVNGVAAGISMFASFMSAITLLGQPQMSYKYSIVSIWKILGYFMVCAFTAQVFIPVFYRLDINSLYEYLQFRYNKALRKIGLFLFVLHMTLYLPIAVDAPVIALHTVTGIPTSTTILCLGLVCTIYSAFGGLQATIWAEFVQGCTMIVGLVIIMIRAVHVVGSWSHVVEDVGPTGRLKWIELSPDPTIDHTLWTDTIGAFVTFAYLYGCNYVTIQRALACKSLEHAQLAMCVNAPFLATYHLLGTLMGLLLADFYLYCDPITLKHISNSDQLLPFFVMEICKSSDTGLAGVFVATVLCAALSTMSSGINAVSAALYYEFIHGKASTSRVFSEQVPWAHLIACCYGLLLVLLAFAYTNLEGIFEAAYSIHNVIGGPVLGVFLMAVFMPSVNSQGALMGLMMGFMLAAMMMSGLTIWRPTEPGSVIYTHACEKNTTTDSSTYPQPTKVLESIHYGEGISSIFKMSKQWVAPINCLVTILVGVMTSYLTGSTDKPVDPMLICDFLDDVWPFYYLPESFRSNYRYDFNSESLQKLQTTTQQPPYAVQILTTQYSNLSPQGKSRDTTMPSEASGTQVYSKETAGSQPSSPRSEPASEVHSETQDVGLSVDKSDTGSLASQASQGLRPVAQTESLASTASTRSRRFF